MDSSSVDVLEACTLRDILSRMWLICITCNARLDPSNHTDFISVRILDKLGDLVHTNRIYEDIPIIEVLKILGVNPVIDLSNFYILIKPIRFTMLNIYSNCLDANESLHLVITSTDTFVKIFRDKYGNKYNSILSLAVSQGYISYNIA